jgi:uncharacterized protein
MGDAFLGLLLALVVSGIVSAAVFAAGGWEDSDEVPLWALAVLQVPLWAGMAGAPLWATYLKGRRSLAEDFGLRMRWVDVPVGLVAGFVGQFALVLVLAVVYELLGVDSDEVGAAAREFTDRATDPLGVVLLFIVVVVGAPIFEELFYRGLWLRSLERRFGTVAAVVLSSALFAFMHLGQWYDMPALAGIGAIMAVLAVRSGRLGPAIWAHVAFNLTGLISLLTLD